MYEWTVVGAGPAGIASVGTLLDAGVQPDAIAWVDPAFKGGDFGTSWRYVSSNTPVKYFIKFYKGCASFGYDSPDRPPFMIDKLPENSNCPLILAAEPLFWITKSLCERVTVYRDVVTGLSPVDSHWGVRLSEGMLKAKKVILALGSAPEILHFDGIPTIPLSTALNPALLKTALGPEDVVAVFGAAQSARTVIENLASISVRKKILFYRSEHTFNRHLDSAVDLSQFEVLPMTPENMLAQMPTCTQAIYGIGFKRRHIPIAGLPASYAYSTKTGEIAPGVFGLGIAFPEILPYELGKIDYPVSAIWPFMKRVQKLVPQWMNG